MGGPLLLVWASPVAAHPTARLALTWNGPPGCPTAENVQARVDALLGGEASASSVADVRASGQVERTENGFRLLLSMGVGTTPSSRVIEARSCEELAGAAAIAIALLARSTLPGASSSPAEPTPAAASNPPESPPPPPIPKPKREAASRGAPPAEAPSTGVRLILAAPVGVAGWGSLPSAGLGLGAALGIRWRSLRVTAAGELWRPQTHERSGFAARFALQSGRAQACLTQAAHGIEVGPCLGAAMQRLAGEGLGSDVFSARSRTATWVSGLGGIYASVVTPGFSHLRFFGEAAVLVSPQRPRFVIDQLGTVHEPALAAPQLNLGCEWIF